MADVGVQPSGERKVTTHHKQPPEKSRTGMIIDIKTCLTITSLNEGGDEMASYHRPICNDTCLTWGLQWKRGSSGFQ